MTPTTTFPLAASVIADPLQPRVSGVWDTDSSGAPAAFEWRTIPKWALLVAGALALPLASLKWNVAPLAWVGPVPLLMYVRADRTGWRGRLWLLLALLVGANLMTLKFLTPPIPWLMVPAYGVPIGVTLWLVYTATALLRLHSGERWGLYAFPALMALAEAGAYRLTEVGVWGAAANTQLDDLRLLQLASLFGVSGIGFLMAWTASVIALLICVPARRRYRLDVLALMGTLALVYVYGSIRLHAEQPGPTVKVAGIVADLGPSPAGLPDKALVARNTDELFRRSEAAAMQGARLVVWNEAATVVEPAEEPAFLDRGAQMARRHNVDLVLAYIVPLTGSRYRMENKYVWFSEQGEVLETYYKHHPVPGEGSVRGEGTLRALRRPYATVAGAICYDYDFPAMALGHARAGAGLVVVPASDWRGIDPYHTQMARVRAIEGGYSLIRPVRWATSGAFDAYGRQRAAMSHFEDNDRIMMAMLPVQPRPTLYAHIGDSAILIYILILLGALGAAFRANRRSAL
jgi:apolipoprotein N-acyltransferase